MYDWMVRQDLVGRRCYVVGRITRDRNSECKVGKECLSWEKEAFFKKRYVENLRRGLG